VDPSWERFRNNVQQAVAAIVAGDARPYTQCWTAREDATLFGAFGGVVRGQREIAARLAAVAGRYVEGRYTRMDILGEAATSELAYLVHVERIESVDHARRPVVRERRVTHVARREEDGWRIVHQHSDPLVEVQLPPGS
jgi:ketosteroid isomerase-like protein